MRTVEIWVRSILFNLVYLFWLIVPTVLFLWTLFLKPDLLAAIVVKWQEGLAWFEKHIAGIDYRVVGAENLPQGACIVAAKHQSAWETCKLLILFKNPSIVLKKELTYVPIWGWYAKFLGLIPIDRKAGVKSLAKMMRAARSAAEEGRKIVIFPQGTRVRPGVRKPYKAGVAGLYLELNLPVVPMAVNSGLFWPKGAFFKKPGTITIAFLPPIQPGLSKSAFLHALEERLEATSAALASAPAGPWPDKSGSL